MVIIIWAALFENEFLEKAKSFVENNLMGRRSLVRNPQFYVAGQHERADVVIVLPRWRDVIRGYSVQGAQVVTDVDTSPAFKIVPVDQEPAKTETGVPAPAVHIPAEDNLIPETPVKIAPIVENDSKTGEKTESGSLSSALNAVLQNLPKAAAAPAPVPDTGTAQDLRGPSEDTADTGKKKIGRPAGSTNKKKKADK